MKNNFLVILFAMLVNMPMVARADGSLRAFYVTHTETYKCRYVTVDMKFKKVYADCFDGDVLDSAPDPDYIHINGFDLSQGDWSYEVTLNGAWFNAGNSCTLEYHEEADNYVHVGLSC